MPVSPQPCLASMGLTKRVQPYCRLATMAIQMTPTINWSQRPPGGPLSAFVWFASISTPLSYTDIVCCLVISCPFAGKRFAGSRFSRTPSEQDWYTVFITTDTKYLLGRECKGIDG